MFDRIAGMLGFYPDNDPSSPKTSPHLVKSTSPAPMYRSPTPSPYAPFRSASGAKSGSTHVGAVRGSGSGSGSRNWFKSRSGSAYDAIPCCDPKTCRIRPTDKLANSQKCYQQRSRKFHLKKLRKSQAVRKMLATKRRRSGGRRCSPKSGSKCRRRVSKKASRRKKRRSY